MFGVPVWKKDYSDTAHVQAAAARIRAALRPGDFVNFDAAMKSWWDIAESFAWKLIPWDQKKVFGGNSCFKDIHSVIYFDPDRTFSMEYPKGGVYNKLEDYCLDPIAIYRYQRREFDAQDIAIMIKHADKLIGVKYDLGLLVKILFETILDTGRHQRIRIRKRSFVCSTAVRVIFENWRKVWNRTHPGQPRMHRLFDTFNGHLDAPYSRVRDLFYNGLYPNGVEYEMTSPAHFANSAFYGHEFRLVAQFDNGEDVG
ncbi:MAG: hypothetical protein HPY53_16200 [Brevinematales bacterium]|nr:hypothetical protein [Brevinematales bacterium]